MPTLHVISHKDEIDPHRLSGKVVVVFDVLFATSTIVTALSHGAAGVIPALDEHSARSVARRLTGRRVLLAGEKNAEHIDGFGPFAPLALSQEAIGEALVILSTTNGTVALERCRPADEIYAAALLNGAATARALMLRQPPRDILMVCAGSVGRFNIEDFLGAGHLIASLTRLDADRWSLTDTALAAQALYRGADTPDLVKRCRVGRMVVEMGLAAELDFCTRVDHLDIACTLRGETLVAIEATP